MYKQENKCITGKNNSLNSIYVERAQHSSEYIQSELSPYV